MTLNWVYKLGEWNPQFFREIKGRLTRHHLAITAIASLSIQALILGYFWVALPSQLDASNRYCTGQVSYNGYECMRDAAKNVLVNWSRWWFDLFQLLGWSLPFILLIAGVYLLMTDLSKEERRGTLNFIRLSPQSSQSILLGKMLGVPIVPFVAVALAVPLHLVSAVGAGIQIDSLFSIYVLTGAIAATYFTGALLFAFLGGFQGWVGAIAVWSSFSVFLPYALTLQRGSTLLSFPNQFAGVAIGHHTILTLVFWVITLSVATFWLWQAVNRRFRNPTATLLSKTQSYWMTASFEFWLLGFVMRTRSEYARPIEDLAVMSMVNLLWFVLLMVAILPQRQSLLDWARYRRERTGSNKGFWSRSVIKDLFRSEKAPGVVAIAVNFVVAVGVFTPWVLTWATQQQRVQSLMAVAFTSVFLLICAVIVQIVLFFKSSRRTLWAAIILAGLIVLPPTTLGTLAFYPDKVPFAWLFSAFAFAGLGYVNLAEICIAFFTQLSVLGVLALQFSRQLRKAGESESKALLAPAKS